MAAIPTPRDNATQSNYQDIRTTALDLEWNVDWQHRIIRGHVKHSLKAEKNGVDKLILDTSYLAIKRCHIPSSSHTDLSFSLPSKRHPNLGSALTITLPHALKKDEKLEVVIEYSTTDGCTALGWLEKEQTDSKKYPFMYSQCQAIHCRSLCPIMDTPAVKFPYTATVHSPLPILLSALRVSPPLEAPQPPIDGTLHMTKWHQPIAIPSYLLAIAGGEVAFRPLGERTGVWAEAGKVNACAREFQEDAERFIKTAEQLCGPYKWGRYDALVLPFSFPFGGMENPNMTFLTPALIVGDRSQVDVLAHEASHSWHGNDVGVAAWDSFWLNEGWTTYTERLIALRLHGPQTRDFEYIIGAKSMNDDLRRYDRDGWRKAQRLHIPYDFGEDPDEFYSSVAYDKGANFLYYLEKLVGGVEVFNPYQKAYIKEFGGKAVSTKDWEDHFWSYWNQYPEKVRILKEKVDWDAWLNGEGTELPVKMEYDTTLADRAYALASSWNSSRSLSPSDLANKFSKSDLEGMSSTQIVLFLETLGTYDKFEEKVIEAVEKAYGFDASHDPEIRLRWYLVALKSGLYASQAAYWVRNQGRMKYCRPTYRAVFSVDPELAKQTFLKYGKGFLHPIARRMVAQDLGLEEGEKKEK
ncbi:Leucyl aminopeptidase yscIV [Rhodotorula toruloides]